MSAGLPKNLAMMVIEKDIAFIKLAVKGPRHMRTGRPSCFEMSVPGHGRWVPAILASDVRKRKSDLPYHYTPRPTSAR